MNEHDMVKFYVKHQVNRYVSAALLAFGRAIDKAASAGERVTGRTFAVKYKAPNQVICQAIGQVISNAKSEFAYYEVQGNQHFLLITCTVNREPKDLGELQRQEKNRIEDTFAQEDENYSGSTKDDEMETEVIAITKEDLDAERTVH